MSPEAWLLLGTLARPAGWGIARAGVHECPFRDLKQEDQKRIPPQQHRGLALQLGSGAGPWCPQAGSQEAGPAARAERALCEQR